MKKKQLLKKEKKKQPHHCNMNQASSDDFKWLVGEFTLMDGYLPFFKLGMFPHICLLIGFLLSFRKLYLFLVIVMIFYFLALILLIVSSLRFKKYHSFSDDLDEFSASSSK